jgi:hypothetical protein
LERSRSRWSALIALAITCACRSAAPAAPDSAATHASASAHDVETRQARQDDRAAQSPSAQAQESSAPGTPSAKPDTEQQGENAPKSDATPPPEAQAAALPKLAPAADKDYETPRAGEGFWTRIFGREVTVFPQDRRSLTAWDLGAAYTHGAVNKEWEPIGAVFLWRRPDDDNYFRAVLNGLSNEVEYAHSPSGWGPFEVVATFDSLVYPVAASESIDGVPDKSRELLWGRLHAGVGLGYRVGIEPGKADNMFATSITYEPGYLFFDPGSEAAANFISPADTFEHRVHWRVRWDALERNLLELAHNGYALGMDMLAGHRIHWNDWGIDSEESANHDRNYLSWTGYARAATGVFGLNERHRLIYGLHAGVGDNLDRFSAPRVGGGPEADEYGAVSYAVIPGALPYEFFPEDYCIATLEYRFEPLFFTYIGIEGSLAWLDRERRTDSGIESEDGLMSSIGLRLTTGFLFNMRLETEVHYNFDVVRERDLGGYAVTFHFSRKF